MQTSYRPAAGDIVTGTYCGVPFRGTVRNARTHTMNWAVDIVNVDFEQPIDFNGSLREGAQLWIEAGRPDRDTITLVHRDRNDGKCHNAEPGTYGHECGKPAEWVGTAPSTMHPGATYASGYCDRCKRNGWEARNVASWARVASLATVEG